MAANNRIHFGCTACGFSKIGLQSFTRVKGLQSIGMTTTFDLEQAFQIGEIQIYQNLENIPNVEITLEQLLDGSPPAYLMATNGAISPTLTGRANVASIFAIDLYPDTQDAASGTPISECQVSGALPSAFGFDIPVEGLSKSTCSLVAYNKVWTTGVGTFQFTNAFPGNSQPPAITGSGGVNRRQNVIFDIPSGVNTLDVNGMVNVTSALPATIIPPDIDGISASGTNLRAADGTFQSRVQSVSISVDLGRTPLYQLGIKSPYFRYVSPQIAVKTDFDVNMTKWDAVSATEAGVAGNGNNLFNRTIKLKMQEGTYVDCGVKNKLTNVSYNISTGQGASTVKYSYETFNDCAVYHPADPSGL